MAGTLHLAAVNAEVRRDPGEPRAERTQLRAASTDIGTDSDSDAEGRAGDDCDGPRLRVRAERSRRQPERYGSPIVYYVYYVPVLRPPPMWTHMPPQY